MSCTLILCSTSAERCVHDNKHASYRFTPATGRFHFDRAFRVRAPSRRAVKSFQQGNGAGVVRGHSGSSLTPASGATSKQKRAEEYWHS